MIRDQPDPVPVSPRPQPPQAPPAVYSQHQKRERRRQHLRVLYVGDFDLAAEVRAIVTPLAKQLRVEPNPAAHRGHVDAVADAVHALVSASIGFIAERDGWPKVRHLDGRPGDRTKALRTIADLQPRPAAPVFADADLTTGAWLTVLVKLAQPYVAPLAAVLAGALPPDDDRLKGAPSISERLVAELRELDRAARLLRERVRRSQFYREQCPPPPPVDRKRDEAHAALAELGVSL